MHSLLRRIWPAVPADVADDLAQLRLARLRAQVPTLYVTTMLVVLTAMSAAHPAAPAYIRFALPLAIVAACGLRLLWWLRRRRDALDAEAARRTVNRMVLIAGVICFTASIWTVLSWNASIPGQRTYYPLFMVVGALAAAFCLSTTRVATLVVVMTGITPVIASLVLLGNWMDRLASMVILLATAFLLRMIHQQHDQLIDLLRLQNRMRHQASTDPLTALPNRRALYSALDRALATGHPLGIALIDLDGFKPVNDAHGHAAGDRILRSVAERLAHACPPAATAYRLGGDEFAVLMPGAGQPEMDALGTALLGALATPFALDGNRIAIGACLGAAQARPTDDADTLIARADARLYAAKASRQPRGRTRTRAA
jgi:diguanylate cyclase